MNMIKGHVLHKSKEPVEDFLKPTITNPNRQKPTTNSPSLAAFTQTGNEKRKTTKTPQVEMHTSKSTTAVTSTTKKQNTKDRTMDTT